ncbi:YebC/PmpR family DNA-binding transcriptional regulator [Candidatus Poriferisodalis sp.]|uniref:YebC/PmpR family DNA-binding transcriptional regulator n=1 Tax=Candidatus Poriferisodalis sp. TaxID=3101277 RepID=UPI003B02C000
MSGHSKWATIKHRKGAADKARGKLFAKLIRQVEVAAREGGGDLDANATLRTMYQKARDNSVPLDTIERAIKRGTGELEGVSYEQVTYEGYAPGGVAMFVDVLTDNRNRTGSEIRSLFTRAGGSLAEPGAVAWQFERKGVVVVPAAAPDSSEGAGAAPDEDELILVALDAGAEDVEQEGDTWRVTAAAADTMAVREAIEAAGIAVTSADLTYAPQNLIELTSVSEAKQVMAVLDALDDHDDVQGVYANFDISDSLLEAIAG